MSLDVVYGEPRHRVIALRLADELQSVASEGTVYLGYPVLATADDRVYIDALLVSAEHGLVAFQIAEGIPSTTTEWDACIDDQDRLFSVLDSHLGRHTELRRGRHLAVDIHTVTVFPDRVNPPSRVSESGDYCSIEEVPSLVRSFSGLEGSLARSLQAALQRVTTIKPAKRRSSVIRPDSRGAILKRIEKGIANLDKWQKQAAIETPEGPQRIRGLAGSGKTIVLALKAAYLHAQHPDWRIAVAFQSRALYQQLEDLVTRFTFEHSNDKPDFDRLQLLHAWGASNRDGVYRQIARSMKAPYRDFNYAVSSYGRDEAFAGVCRELLELSSVSDDPPIFDAVLIDEAQDLPVEFFKLVYRFTKEPKRIVWAFDELQNLSDAAMPATDELFGTTPSGDSLVSLEETSGEARRDIVLPVCYRNPPWALATAHGIGFGIYREGGLVQHFDDVELWADIGYRVVAGRLVAGRRVELERAPASYPDYFPELLTPDDSVVIQSFGSEAEQDSWIADQIHTNLSQDELQHDDILVVLPDAYTSKRRAARFSRVLARRDIQSHLAGVATSVDQVFVPESVAIAHIFRAKGNEAPMVYVVDSQYGARPANIVSRRNTLFTAVTRSRAWVRICGWGEPMDDIRAEISRIQEKGFRLDFKIPSTAELAKLRRIHRERSQSEVEEIERHTRSLSEALEALDRGELELHDLPPRLRTRLLRIIEADLATDNDSDGHE